MKYPFFHVAALTIATIGITAAHAEDNNRTGTNQHGMTSPQDAYFSGAGFSSQRNAYAARRNEPSAQKTASASDSNRKQSKGNGHHFSSAEAQFFSGSAFESKN